jgi:hypothetical protein
MCVLIPLYMCSHTSIYVFSYYYMCVLILLHVCPQVAQRTSSERKRKKDKKTKRIANLLLYVCPHTTSICVSSGCAADELLRQKKEKEKEEKGQHQPTAICVSSYCYMCVLRVLSGRALERVLESRRLPHLFQVSTTTDTTMHMSSILLHTCPQYYVCPQYYYKCVLNTTIYVSSSKFLKTSSSAEPFPSQYYYRCDLCRPIGVTSVDLQV